MRALFASPLGFLIGLSLGALGGGGSILAIPALVYGAGQGAKPASATSLILVAITSAIGLLPHWRAGRVRWGAGLLFGLAGSGAALLGGWMASGVNGDLLLLLFSGVMVAAAVMMWRRARPGSTHVATTGSAVITVDAGTVVKVLVAGSVVGMLTGFFGVGGGFVIVPMLVLALGFSMPEAVGTSLVVIIINSMVALTTRLKAGNVEWKVVVPFVVASLLGVLVGSHLAGKRDAKELQRWFVGLLVIVAVYTAIRSAVALAS